MMVSFCLASRACLFGLFVDVRGVGGLFLVIFGFLSLREAWQLMVYYFASQNNIYVILVRYAHSYQAGENTNYVRYALFVCIFPLLFSLHENFLRKFSYVCLIFTPHFVRRKDNTYRAHAREGSNSTLRVVNREMKRGPGILFASQKRYHHFGPFLVDFG